MFELIGNHAYNVDCMELMREVPDKYFDLAVVDPPYGDASSQNVQVERERERVVRRARHGQGRNVRQPDGTWGYARWREVEQVRTAVRPIQDGGIMSTGGGWHGKDKYPLGAVSDPDGRDLGGEVRKKIIAWDVAPEKEYFDELFRVSRNQIIWGGNYFALPPTRCFLVWRKLTISESFSMAMAEYAWTSFNGNAKVFEAAPQGKKDDPRFHPTAKPVELYAWIYRLFAKEGDRILDTHLGSGSSRIAAYNAGLDFIGCEIDPVYFEKQEERFDRHTAQMNLFLEQEV